MSKSFVGLCVTTLGWISCSVSEQPTSTESPDLDRWREIKQKVRSEFDDVSHVSVLNFAAERPTGDALVIDVREPDEYEVSRIPGARNQPLLAGVAAPLLDGLSDEQQTEIRNRPIVVYCSVGWRSSQAARELAEAGFRNVRNLEGSIFEWANADQPLVNDAGPAQLVHPYNADWGLLLRSDRRAPNHR